jgi:hypothetical protein
VFLNKEDHKECDDRRACIYDELPGIRVVEELSRDRTHRDDSDRAYECPLGTKEPEAAAANLPKASPWLCLRPLSATTSATSRRLAFLTLFMTMKKADPLLSIFRLAYAFTQRAKSIG